MKLKNRKTTVFSLAALTLLTVCGVGFSAWIIGVNQPTKTLDSIPVEVDTISEETCYLNIAVANNDGIVIADTSKTASNKVGSGIGAKNQEADLSITLSSYEFAFATTSTFNSLTFAVTSNGRALEGTVPSSDPFGREAEQAAYIELASYTYTDIESPDSDFTKEPSVEGYNIYRANTKALTFRWGDFFGGNNTSPVDFYYSKINAEGNQIDDKFEAMNQAKTELKDMLDFFKNPSGGYYPIKIVATLSVTANSASN